MMMRVGLQVSVPCKVLSKVKGAPVKSADHALHNPRSLSLQGPFFCSEKFNNLTRCVVLNMWSPSQQHQYPLGTCEREDFRAPPQAYKSETRGGAPQSVV